MRIVDFDEFVTLPAGTIFSFVPNASDRWPGLFCKGISVPGAEGTRPSALITDLLHLQSLAAGRGTLTGEIDDDEAGHRFAILDDRDRARLIGWLGPADPDRS
jgi:hypothetical protein